MLQNFDMLKRVQIFKTKTRRLDIDSRLKLDSENAPVVSKPSMFHRPRFHGRNRAQAPETKFATEPNQLLALEALSNLRYRSQFVKQRIVLQGHGQDCIYTFPETAEEGCYSSAE